MDIVSFVNAYSIAAAILVVIAGVPQAWMIWKNRSAEGVSLLMWVLLAIAMGGFLLRSVVIVHDSVFFIQQAVSEVINLAIIGEIIYFKKQH